ncbi:MAG: ferritin family protein [Dehalococcoidales bacterium]|nr:ferritin family protein [Dehalococcoidales bacterium]
MVTEQGKVLQALQTAIQMEKDGKECYQQAGKESGNELGRKLLQSLAEEEDTHLRKFVEIYDTMRNKDGWPKITFRPDHGKRLRTVFARTCPMVGPGVKAASTELDVLTISIDKENQSFDFYRQKSEQATYPAEKEFFESLAGEEREHSLVLLDYYQYLKDPSSFFVEKEHHSMDGG